MTGCVPSALSAVISPCLAAPLTEVLTLQDDSFTQLRSFYDTLKQCLQIDSISTVAVAVDSSVELSANASADLAESTTSSSSELTTDSPTATSPKEMTTPRLYRITHHFLSEAEAAELLACLTEVFVHCGEMHAELCLWLLGGLPGRQRGGGASPAGPSSP